MIGGGDDVPLRDRSLVGDTHSAALVAADGTIDWWCPGRFDAPAAFFRLLDPAGGALRVAPAGPLLRGQQSYEPGTNVVRTRLGAPGAELEVTDFMPWAGGGRAPGGIVRLLRAVGGRVEVDVDVVAAAGFRPAREVATWSEGIAFEGVVVHTGCPMEGRRGRMVLEPGQRAVVSVETEGTRRPRPIGVDDALGLLERTSTAWRSYLAPMAHDGPYRREVERSLLVLGALTHGPTGALVASATTSLPLREGGERNFDHRHAWVGHAAQALSAVRRVGLEEEADALDGWLAGVLALPGPEPAAVVGLDGAPVDGDGRVQLGLAGYRRSQPVRLGAGEGCRVEAAAELLGTVPLPGQAAGPSQVGGLWPRLAAVADWICAAWTGPDTGIWEMGGPPRHRVSSKLAAWWALDRMVGLARSRNPLDLDAARWRVAAGEIEAWLHDHALAARTAPAGGGLRADPSPLDAADAALLRVAWRTPWSGDHRLVGATVDRVLDQLGEGPFVHRYPQATDDGLPPGQGADLACSFWAVRALAHLGRWDQAHDRMESLCAFLRPSGSAPAAAEPLGRSYLGNLPSAPAHVALVEAALSLEPGPR